MEYWPITKQANSITIITSATKLIFIVRDDSNTNPITIPAKESSKALSNANPIDVILLCMAFNTKDNKAWHVRGEREEKGVTRPLT
jgi:phosphotransferase system IIB component